MPELTVFTFSSDWGLPSTGPFAMKLIKWLEIAGMPYRQQFEDNPRKSPKGKNPWVEIDGERIGDTEIIIDLLAKRSGFGIDDAALRIHEDLNPGTASVQYMLAQFNTSQNWQREIGQSGLYATYLSLFGDPFADAVQTLTPPGLEQPYLVLPFPSGQEWFFTGGPHGGWGSGSAWAAVDFAPPDDPETMTSSCYVSSNFVTAVAPGVIARTTEGVAVLDLDGDGDEATGWSILYLHVDEQDRVRAGDIVQAGDRIGRPSCDGGFTNGTHLHIARRYNGEWLPTDCTACPADNRVPNFVMSGWTFFGYTRQEYQGYMLNGDQERMAWQGRENPANRIVWN